jgi:neurotrimin
VSSEGSSLVVREGDNVSLSCEASGYPPPHIVWRREDGDDILIAGRKVLSKHIDRFECRF